MRNLTIYLVVLVCSFMSKIYAQNFSVKAELIASNIENIVNEEKQALKKAVEAVNVELDKGNINKTQADEQKLKLAETSAAAIEKRVAAEEAKLTELVKQKVDGKISEKSVSPGEVLISIIKNNPPKRNDTIERSEKRTTSQFIYAFGVNNLMTKERLAHSDFRYMGSHFFEWGMTYNTRILKDNNLLHLTYGFSVMYNSLRATDNRYFVENGNKTGLQEAGIHLKDTRFKNVNLVVPMYLEFDFSGNQIKDDKPFFKTHKSARFGLGGFAGVNLKTKQTLKFDDEFGNSVVQKTKGDFNVNDFVYGVGAYVGYKETSLYIKYDLNPLFRNNTADQNNISLGLRFDLN